MATMGAHSTDRSTMRIVGCRLHRLASPAPGTRTRTRKLADPNGNSQTRTGAGPAELHAKLPKLAPGRARGQDGTVTLTP